MNTIKIKAQTKRERESMINPIKLNFKQENTTVRDNDIMLDDDFYWFVIYFLLSFAIWVFLMIAEYMDNLTAIMECGVLWIIL